MHGISSPHAALLARSGLMGPSCAAPRGQSGWTWEAARDQMWSTSGNAWMSLRRSALHPHPAESTTGTHALPPPLPAPPALPKPGLRLLRSPRNHPPAVSSCSAAGLTARSAVGRSWWSTSPPAWSRSPSSVWSRMAGRARSKLLRYLGTSHHLFSRHISCPA